MLGTRSLLSESQPPTRALRSLSLAGLETGSKSGYMGQADSVLNTPLHESETKHGELKGIDTGKCVRTVEGLQGGKQGKVGLPSGQASLVSRGALHAVPRPRESCDKGQRDS